MKIYHSQELEEFHQTQIGRSVKEGISNVTIFHERTPTDSRSILFRDWSFWNVFLSCCSDPLCFLAFASRLLKQSLIGVFEQLRISLNG